MLIIGENIQILSPRIRRAIDERDPKPLQELAKLQVEGGARMLDLNIGRRKKDGHEVMPWLVEIIHDVVPEVGLSLDTTNPLALEAGLKRCKELGIEAMVNSTSAEEERLAVIPPLAAKYNAKLIALTLGKGGLPVSAEARVNVALETLIPRAQECGIPMEDLYLDPLVMTVAGTQQYVPHAIEAIRYFKAAAEPPPKTVVGLSNVSNGVPKENRSLINRTYLIMLMAAGLDAAIADPLDKKQNEFIRIVEERDTSTPVGKLLVNLYDATASMEELDPSLVDMEDPEQAAIYKTVQILLNKVIYAESYLRM
jgi:5-methyltetrahydrofolate corrinoid/iron sulfur protein methyltransferase